MTDTERADADLRRRHERAGEIVRAAAVTALGHFRARDALAIESKGLQDWVSEADRGVEREIRAALLADFPDDGIVGEEGGRTAGESGFTWVIDPIDGTTNFLAGDPAWCVVLAGLAGDTTVIAHVVAPVVGDRFAARRGHGATLDGRAIAVSTSASLVEGSLGVGHSTRVSAASTVMLLDTLLDAGGLFRRSGSGALDLAGVAAGRLLGYCEPHMNAWDCLASLLLIEEAGGRVQPFEMRTMLAQGGRVVAAAPGVHDDVVALCDRAFGPSDAAAVGTRGGGQV